MGLGKLYKRRPALFFLSVAVFTLTAFPRLNVRIGPMPLYFIDIMVVLTYYYSLKIPRVHKRKMPFSKIVMVIFVFAFLSELFAFIRYDGAPQPIYQLFQTVLVFSLFFSVARIVNDYESIITVFKAGVYGILLTAVLMIMSSLPFTREVATAVFFSQKFLEPAAEGAIEQFEAQMELGLGGVRGRSLVGVSILSGAFINVIWPLAVFLYYRSGTKTLSKKIALLVMLLAPFGVVMSYSRGALFGMFLVVAGVVVFGSSKYKSQIIVSLTIAFIVFNTIGWGSDVFFFERYEERFSGMLEDPYSHVGDEERLNAYSEPFEHLMENPEFTFIGEGVTARKMSYGPLPAQSGKATHALFSIAYYSYGMVAALLYMLLWVSGFKVVIRYMRRVKNKDMMTMSYASILFASLLGMSSLLLFGHAAVSAPRGGYLFFFLFGLISSLMNFRKGIFDTTNVIR